VRKFQKLGPDIALPSPASVGVMARNFL
jgi:hypothetical protein